MFSTNYNSNTAVPVFDSSQPYFWHSIPPSMVQQRLSDAFNKPFFIPRWGLEQHFHMYGPKGTLKNMLHMLWSGKCILWHLDFFISTANGFSKPLNQISQDQRLHYDALKEKFDSFERTTEPDCTLENLPINEMEEWFQANRVIIIGMVYREKIPLSKIWLAPREFRCYDKSSRKYYYVEDYYGDIETFECFVRNFKHPTDQLIEQRNSDGKGKGGGKNDAGQFDSGFFNQFDQNGAGTSGGLGNGGNNGFNMQGQKGGGYGPIIGGQFSGYGNNRGKSQFGGKSNQFQNTNKPGPY